MNCPDLATSKSTVYGIVERHELGRGHNYDLHRGIEPPANLIRNRRRGRQGRQLHDKFQIRLVTVCFFPTVIALESEKWSCVKRATSPRILLCEHRPQYLQYDAPMVSRQLHSYFRSTPTPGTIPTWLAGQTSENRWRIRSIDGSWEIQHQKPEGNRKATADRACPERCNTNNVLQVSAHDGKIGDAGCRPYRIHVF